MSTISRRVYVGFVATQLIVTAILIAMPAKIVLDPERTVTTADSVSWSPEVSVPSAARQMAFALNFPVALPFLPTVYIGFGGLYTGFGGRLTDTVFLLTVW